MSKRIRSLMVGIVVLVVLVGSLVALLLLMPKDKDDDDGTSSVAPTETFQVVDVKSTDIKTLSITNKEDSFVLIQEKADEWSCADLTDLPFDKTQYQSTATSFAAITASQKIDAPENLTDFGLAEPVATAELTLNDGTVVKLSLGGNAPGNLGCYIQKDSDSNVYLIDSYTAESFQKTKKSMIKTSLITSANTSVDPQTGQPVTTSAIESLALSGTNFPEKLVFTTYTEAELQEENAYHMSQFAFLENGKKQDVNSNAFDPIASSFTSFYASEAVELTPSADKLKEYGLDKPSAIADVVFEGKTYRIQVGKKVVPPDGETAADAYYMLFNDYKVVYTVMGSSIPWRDVKKSALTSNMLFITNIDNVSKITVKAEGIDAVFELSGLGEDLVVTQNGKTVSTDNFRNLYQVYIGVTPEEGATDKPTGNPVYTMTFSYKDTSKADSVITLTPNGARRYFYAINGEGSNNVAESVLERLMTKTKQFIEGIEITV